MNKGRFDRTLTDSAVAALNELGIEATADDVDQTSNTVITLRRAGKALQYFADVQRRITPSMVGPISIALSQAGEDHLLITDRVTPPVGDALRLQGVQFVDAAGNAFLNRQDVLVIVTGRTPRGRIEQPKTVRVFKRNGLKLLFALLSTPDLLAAPQRTIAEAADVSLGSVTPLLEGMREIGILAEVRGTRRIVDRDRVIDQWTEGYLRVLEPTLELGRFVAPDGLWWEMGDAGTYGVQWGAETAAWLLDRNLLPHPVIVYANALPKSFLTEHRLKADPNGDVVIRRRFWNAVPSPRPEVVPALLIYADLVATGDARSLAAARRIREKHL